MVAFQLVVFAWVDYCLLTEILPQQRTPHRPSAQSKTMGAWLSHAFIAMIASPWILWLLVKLVTTPDEQYEQGPWLSS
jgi:hypothetical protein